MKKIKYKEFSNLRIKEENLIKNFLNKKYKINNLSSCISSSFLYEGTKFTFEFENEIYTISLKYHFKSKNEDYISLETLIFLIDEDQIALENSKKIYNYNFIIKDLKNFYKENTKLRLFNLMNEINIRYYLGKFEIKKMEKYFNRINSKFDDIDKQIINEYFEKIKLEENEENVNELIIYHSLEQKNIYNMMIQQGFVRNIIDINDNKCLILKNKKSFYHFKDMMLKLEINHNFYTSEDFNNMEEMEIPIKELKLDLI